MPILSGQTSFTGLSGVQPNLVFINTNDTLATVTTAGYLNHAVQEGMLTLQNGYMALVNTTVNQNPHTASVPIWLQVSITGTAPNLVYSLVEPANGGGAIFPGNVQAGLNGTAGAFLSYPATLNTGHLVLAAASNAGNTVNTITNASQAGTRTFTIPDPGTAAANFILSASAGVQHITTGGLQTDAGGLTAGSSGTAGALVSFPAAAASGSLIVQASNSGGAFNTTITNASLGQTTIFTIPDPANAASRFLVAATATPFTTGHIAKASGTGGLMVDAGYAIISATTAAYAGGGTSNAFTATGLSATSIVVASILNSTNAVSITKVVPSNNTLTVSFSADPGAATTVNYIATTAAS